ncbi:S8/S53 family peptidase [Ichthyenterobacterium sp. W332]|uniref:S8/S53 family peptidase n=1 Tax=Microcosmobacter mediterraneus TaxID=3075607 RepID=A0ABU2YJL7_9FLAO|nr:S8/S53 family peptidase [Ichthyenterobacterium sp. W332]MDT0558346.1 S8/S53 family peptidase [Ichthyenterobacterium sp. W332]
MKKLFVRILLILVVILNFNACTKDNSFIEETLDFPKDPLTVDEINARINESFSNNGEFNWEDTDEHFIWSALTHGDYILTVGYGNEGESFSEVRDEALETKKQDLVKLISENEALDLNDIKIVSHTVINVFDIEVKDIKTVIALRQNPNVRYIEPNGYNKFEIANANMQRSSSGCDKNADYINPSHYSTIAPNNAQVAWNFYEHNIPSAWNVSTGSGVTVGLIDTGVSLSQSLLNSSGFNDGYSNGRYVQKYGTFIDSWWWWSNNYDGPHDKCGHGTAMASTIAAPRNDNGMPVGVAYNSNLVAYRATEDVLLNDYHERKGVSDALVQLGNRSDVKIISMSIGYVWSIGNVRDAVRYAHSRGKLIFAAGGTSTSFTNGFGVIFPATMSETIAVTGVDDGSNYERCNTCHSGNKIDFTIIMEGDNNTSKAPPVLSFYNNQRRYTGGSSVATATTAGIAALVWSRYPSWSRTQVLNRLKQSSDFYPYKNSNFGYGNIDALQAVQ